MYAWGKKRKLLVFTAVYVCVQAKLTLVRFFFNFFFLHLSLTAMLHSTIPGFIGMYLHKSGQGATQFFTAMLHFTILGYIGIYLHKSSQGATQCFTAMLHSTILGFIGIYLHKRGQGACNLMKWTLFRPSLFTSWKKKKNQMQKELFNQPIVEGPMPACFLKGGGGLKGTHDWCHIPKQSQQC